MPAVTVSPRPNGLPTAITPSPTRVLSLSPNLTVFSGLSLSTFSTATSTLGSLPMHLGLQLAAVGEDDDDVVGVADDVIVGDDDAAGVDDEAGAERATILRGRGAPFMPWFLKNCSNMSSNGVPLGRSGMRLGALVLDRLGRGNVDHRLGDAVDEVGEIGRARLGEGGRERRRDERRAAMARGERSPTRTQRS